MPLAPECDDAASTYDDPALALIAPYVDARFYLALYADVAAAGIDPVKHFHEYGWQERRKPNPSFDTGWYLDFHLDVKEAGVDPLHHYIKHGRSEGRPFRRPGGYRREIVDAAVAPERRTVRWNAPADANWVTSDDLCGCLKAACVGSRGFVLSVSHDLYIGVTGGIQIVIADEQRRFAAGRVVYLHISPADSHLMLNLNQADPTILQIALDGVFIGFATTLALRDSLAGSADILPRPRSFVLHSFLGHTVNELIELARAMCADHHFCWVHDYSTICTGYNLLRNDLEFCAAPPADSTACRICVYGDARASHLAMVQTLFAALPFHVLAPSDHALELWRRHSELPHLSARVHTHCSFEPRMPIPAAARSDRGTAGEPLRIAFAGHPMTQKGWPLFLALLGQLEDLTAYRFFHFATRESLRPMRNVAAVPVRVEPQQRFAMVLALTKHAIDLVLVLSPWPETFSFVTYEAFAAGADVVTLAASGNAADAVRRHCRGVVLADDPALFWFFRDGAAIEYCHMQAASGFQRGDLRLSGATATIEPTDTNEWTPERFETTDPDLQVLAGDRTLQPSISGSRWRFTLPAGVGQIRLLSRQLPPNESDRGEPRLLGVAVAALMLDGVPVPPDDPRRKAGWYTPEDGAQWTNGDATLDATGAGALEVILHPGARYWHLPLADA